MGRIRRLGALSPDWVSPPGRMGLGLSLDCPGHGPPCKITLLFSNPVDGWRQLDGDDIPLYWREGSGLESLTIVGRIDVPGHWSGFIDDGELLWN